MYARMTTVYVRPEKAEEATDITRDSVLPAAKEQPGFKGMCQLDDYETGKAVVVTLWETREDLEASERNGYYREQLGKFGALLAAEPETEVFEAEIAQFAAE